MHICPECGGKFDGKYCPDCGAQWQEKKTCPRCGAESDGSTRFCSACGYAFSRGAVKVDNDETKNEYIKNMAIFYKYAVLAIFGLLSALMFAFCAAPVETDPFFGISTGNIYERISGAFKDGQSSVSIEFFDMLALLLPIGGIIVLVGGLFTGLTGVRLFKRYDFSCMVYFAFYIAMAISLMASVDEGMKIGAGPVLMFVFSFIFMVAAIIVLVLRKKFYKRYSYLDDQF